MKTFFCSVMFLMASTNAFAGGGHDHHGHDHHEHEEEKRGPHGGKLFSHGNFSLELTIFEKGVPPQFRVFPYWKKKALAPSEVAASITLSRFMRETETFDLTPQSTADGEYLTSPKTVEEPHSFKVDIKAKYKDESFAWSYESHEGRTELSAEALKVAQLQTEVAAPQKISNTARVFGRLLPNENKVAHVFPRFAGVIKEIKKSLGDSVSKGELLAVIESNQSLQSYEIRSQVEGVVIKRHATLGEYVPDTREILVVADLSEIWADFQVYRDDIGPISSGQKISVNLGEGQEVPAIISYVSPVTDEVTQSMLVRAVLPNSGGTLRPGLFVSGILSSTDGSVPLAVKREAIQTFRDWDVVYLTDGHIFQAMPVTLGRKDAKYVEVLEGLNPGDRYVSANSFIIKADIEKSGATHDH